MTPIKPPKIDDFENDWSDCDRFLDECVSTLIGEIACACAIPEFDVDKIRVEATSVVVSMLEAKIASLKPGRGRPPGSRNRNPSKGLHASEATIARRKRADRQREEEERQRAAEHAAFMRIIESDIANNK